MSLRRSRFRAAAVLLGVAAALLAGEAAVRLLSPHSHVTPESQRALRLPYASAIFSRQIFDRGGRDVTYEVFGRTSHCRINRQGYRGPDFDPHKPAGTYRVLVYGGSAVFDLGAEGDLDWPRQVERMLRDAGHARVEVINAGVPGTDAADAFGRLFAEGHEFSPDAVVLSSAWNDLRAFRASAPHLRGRRPYWRTDDPRITYQGPLDKGLCNLSQLYMRLRNRWYTWRLDTDLEGNRSAAAAPEPLPPGGLRTRQYEIAVAMFVALAREIGAVPVLMIEPRLAARDNGPDERARINYPSIGLDHDALCDACDRADTIVRRAAEPQDVELIDAAREMAGRSDLFHDHVHTSAEGSRVLASIVASELARLVR